MLMLCLRTFEAVPSCGRFGGAPIDDVVAGPAGTTDIMADRWTVVLDFPVLAPLRRGLWIEEVCCLKLLEIFFFPVVLT